jgi:hypothetical protein
MKRLFYFLSLFLIIGLYGCPDREPKPDSTLTIINNSNFDILHQFDSQNYPDTTLKSMGGFKDPTQYKLAIIEKNSREEKPDRWIWAFETFPMPIMLFLFSRDTIDKVPLEKIQKEYKVLRRYDLTKAKLDSLNWTITYP